LQKPSSLGGGFLLCGTFLWNMIQSKLPRVGTTIFTVMSGLATETGAINLSQGFPDFPVERDLISLVNQNMEHNYNQYAPMSGTPELRSALAAKYKLLYGRNYDPQTEITITAGGTQAIYTAITALVQPENEVILFAPAYDCYAPAVELSGGRPVYYEMHAPDYAVDWNKVKSLVNRKTRLIIINTPHNPSGTAWTEKDLLALQDITKGSDIIVLSDEVYEHIIFDGMKHQTVALYDDLSSRSIVVGSFGKTFHATGWKVGYAAAPAPIMKEFRKIHQFVTFAVNHPVQRALAEYIQNPDHYNGVAKMYEEKRDRFASAIAGSRFGIRPSNGTYFQLLDYSEITNEKDTDYAVRLTREMGVASIPVSVFYPNGSGDKVLRFCFAKENETLDRAAEILRSI
jgi:methionine aminotransferase